VGTDLLADRRNQAINSDRTCSAAMLAVVYCAVSLLLSNVPSLSWLHSGFAKVGQIPQDCCALVQYITPNYGAGSVVCLHLQFATGCNAYEADQKGTKS